MTYSTEPRTRKYVKGYEYLSFVWNYPTKMGKNYWIVLWKTETELVAAKTLFKKVFYKTAKAIGELIENKST